MENTLIDLLLRSKELMMNDIEQKMLICRIEAYNYSEIKKCINDKRLEEYREHLTRIYNDKVLFLVSKVVRSRDSLESLIKKYHKQEGDVMILSIAINIRIKKCKNFPALCLLADRYNVHKITGNIVEHAKNIQYDRQ